MKAIARVIRSSVRARAATANGVVAAAYAMPLIQPKAEVTEQSGLVHWLRVTPEEPQQLVWLVPQVGIDYDIQTSTGLKWHIF